MDDGHNLPAVPQIDAAQLPVMLHALEAGLEGATTARAMIGVKDAAAALQRLTDTIEGARDAHYKASEIMIRAYVKLGHWLRSLPRNPGGPQRRDGSQPLTIPELGVKRSDATRAQRLCLIPAGRLEEWFDERRRTEREISVFGAMQVFREIVPLKPAGPRSKMGAARKAAVRSYRENPCETTLRSIEANLREGLRRIVPMTSPEVLAALFLKLREVIDEAEAVVMQERESAGLAGQTFEDNPRAARRECQHRGMPPERMSLVGSSARTAVGG